MAIFKIMFDIWVFKESIRSHKLTTFSLIVLNLLKRKGDNDQITESNAIMTLDSYNVTAEIIIYM